MRVEGQSMAADIISNKLNPGQAKKTNNMENNPGKPKTNAELNKKQLSEEELQITTDAMNEIFKITNYHLQFRVHKESGRIQVKLIDSDSEKVIREIPPDKVLEYSARIRNMLNEMLGILLDEKI